MNRRKAMKHARELVKYIMSQSYEFDETMQEYLAERIALTLRLNSGEISQDTINSLIGFFRREKETMQRIDQKYGIVESIHQRAHQMEAV